MEDHSLSTEGGDLISKKQMVALAEKHGTTYVEVRRLSLSLQRTNRDYELWSPDRTREAAERQDRNGKYHKSAMLWFISMAKERKLSLYQACDLLVALAVGQK